MNIINILRFEDDNVSGNDFYCDMYFNYGDTEELIDILSAPHECEYRIWTVDKDKCKDLSDALEWFDQIQFPGFWIYGEDGMRQWCPEDTKKRNKYFKQLLRRCQHDAWLSDWNN